MWQCIVCYQDAFKAGKHFVQKYSDDTDTLDNLQPSQRVEGELFSRKKVVNDERNKKSKTLQDADNCPLMAPDGQSDKKTVDSLAQSFAAMSSSIDEDTGTKAGKKLEKEELGKDILDSLSDSKFKMLTFKVQSSDEQSPVVKREIEDYQIRKGKHHCFSFVGLMNILLFVFV